MPLWKPDITIEFSVLPPEDGGRTSAIPVGSCFRCSLCIDGQYFDIRLDLSAADHIVPSIKTTVPAKFLQAERALLFVKEDSALTLWEGKVIAIGKVVSTFPNKELRHSTLLSGQIEDLRLIKPNLER